MFRKHSAWTTAAAIALAVGLTGCGGGSGPGSNGGPPAPGGLGSALNALSSALSAGDGPVRLGPNVARDASPGDDVYKPHSNVEDEAAIALDAADIIRSTSDGNLSPSDIRGIYENGKNARNSSARAWASNPDLAAEFPVETRYYGTGSFLDVPLMEAIDGTGSAVDYSTSQRAQAVSGSLYRFVAYSMLHQLQIAEAKLKKGDPDPDDRSHNYVDRAWALYTATDSGEKQPGSLAMTASDLERAFGRAGLIDKPLRTALSTMQDGADRRNLDVFLAARADVEGRLNSIFFLATARQFAMALSAAERGDMAAAAEAQVLGASAYATLQPAVAAADADADQAITAYFAAGPTELTGQRRDVALSALNRASTALNLKAADRVTAADL